MARSLGILTENSARSRPTRSSREAPWVCLLDQGAQLSSNCLYTSFFSSRYHHRHPVLTFDHSSELVQHCPVPLMQNSICTCPVLSTRYLTGFPLHSGLPTIDSAKVVADFENVSNLMGLLQVDLLVVFKA